MAPPVTSTKLRLPYPLFCAEFLDESHLLIAGGGGESKSGVGNAIAVIDISSSEPSIKSSIELSRDEDSVMSMALIPNTTPSTLFAGINQNEAKTQTTSKNEHFRIFTVTPDAVKAVSSHQHFEPTHWDEIYQRTTVVSPSGRFAAIVASKPKVVEGKNYAGEIVVLRIDQGKQEKVAVQTSELEIVDADVLSTDTEEYIVHATSLSYFHRKFIPGSETHEITRFDVHRFVSKGTVIRAVRYLSPSLMLLILNQQSRTGAELLIISFKAGQSTMLVLQRHLHKGIKAVTAVDLVHLPPSSPTSSQTVLAIAGADLSVEILLLDIDDETKVHARTYQVLHKTHDFPATKVAFSKLEKNAHTLQLASVSAANSLVVHKIHLADPSHLKQKSNTTATTLITIFSLLFIVLLAVALQLVFEYRGDLPKAGERIAHVWEEVVDSVVGGGGAGKGGYERVKGRVGEFVNDMRGVEHGVQDSLKKEGVQAVLEGVMGAMG